MKKEAINYNLIILVLWIVAIFISLGIATNCILITLNRPIYVKYFYDTLLTIYNFNRLCFQIGGTTLIILLLTSAKWIFFDENFQKFLSLRQTWCLRRYIRHEGNYNFNSTIKFDFIKITEKGLECWLKIPATQKEADELQRNLNSIYQYITNINATYTFSAFERNNQYYKLKGTQIE